MCSMSIGRPEKSGKKKIENGRILITIKDNRVHHASEILADEHVLSLDSFMELAHRAGYLIIRKDKLLSLSNEW